MTFYLTMLLVGWLILLGYLFCRYQLQASVFWLAGLILALLLAVFVVTFPHVVSRVDSSAARLILAGHALFSFFAYAAFLLALGASLVYLLQENFLKKKSVNLLGQRLPSLEALEKICVGFGAAGFLSLSLGMSAGLAWSQLSKGCLFSGQPKELWSILTWFVFGGYFLAYRFSGWGRHKLLNLLVVCCLVVILSYVGIRIF